MTSTACKDPGRHDPECRCIEWNSPTERAGRALVEYFRLMDEAGKCPHVKTMGAMHIICGADAVAGSYYCEAHR